MVSETKERLWMSLYNRYAQESTHLKGDANEARPSELQQYQGCFNMGRFGGIRLVNNER